MPNEHEFFMRRCFELALIAKQRGESPVGSIIVEEGKIIGEGIEAVKSNADVTFHAEIEALRQAVKMTGRRDFSECTLYTTHEPCIMCSYAIRQAKIKAIVMALTTGALGGFSSHYPLLTDASITEWPTPPEIIAGVLADECRRLIKVG